MACNVVSPIVQFCSPDNHFYFAHQPASDKLELTRDRIDAFATPKHLIAFNSLKLRNCVYRCADSPIARYSTRIG